MNDVLRLPFALLLLFYQSIVLALSQIWANKIRGIRSAEQVNDVLIERQDCRQVVIPAECALQAGRVQIEPMGHPLAQDFDRSPLGPLVGQDQRRAKQAQGNGPQDQARGGRSYSQRCSPPGTPAPVTLDRQGPGARRTAIRVLLRVAPAAHTLRLPVEPISNRGAGL